MKGNQQLRGENGATKEIDRALQDVIVFNQIHYAMVYRSNHMNVTNYPIHFQGYINEDLD
jgi:hypothetical protein